MVICVKTAEPIQMLFGLWAWEQTAECHSYFLGPVWCTQSIVLTVNCGSAIF